MVWLQPRKVTNAHRSRLRHRRHRTTADCQASRASRRLADLQTRSPSPIRQSSTFDTLSARSRRSTAVAALSAIGDAGSTRPVSRRHSSGGVACRRQLRSFLGRKARRDSGMTSTIRRLSGRASQRFRARLSASSRPPVLPRRTFRLRPEAAAAEQLPISRLSRTPPPVKRPSRTRGCGDMAHRGIITHATPASRSRLVRTRLPSPLAARVIGRANRAAGPLPSLVPTRAKATAASAAAMTTRTTDPSEHRPADLVSHHHDPTLTTCDLSGRVDWRADGRAGEQSE